MLPIFVTETNTRPPWEDCTWAGGLMLAQKATNNAIPGTLAEREALRRASGDRIGGSSLDDLSRGTQIRYGWPTPRFPGTVQQLLDALATDHGAAVQGLYADLPSALQRWDRQFAAKGSRSGHLAYVEDLRPDGTMLWMDPLAREPWAGERISIGVLLGFLYGPAFAAVKRAGEHAPAVIAPEPDPTAEGDDVLFNIAPSKTLRDAVLKEGTVLFRDAKLTRRYSRVATETALGFLGSGATFHVVVNGGYTNFVRRSDVDRFVANERTYS